MADTDPTEPPTRVVLLGASNLEFGFERALDAARARLGERLEVLAAMGAGRSYRRETIVGFRGLPSILDCGLWDALASRPPAPTRALVTDIGNDIIYEAQVGQIVEAVEECLDRLAAVGASAVIGGPPLETLRQLGQWRYRWLRSVLVPTCVLPLGEVLARAEQLDARLAELGSHRNVAYLRPLRRWYGWDPIHVRRRDRLDAWMALTEPWGGEPEGRLARGHRSPSAFRLWPRRVTLLGWPVHTAQPVFRLGEAFTVALY